MKLGLSILAFFRYDRVKVLVDFPNFCLFFMKFANRSRVQLNSEVSHNMLRSLRFKIVIVLILINTASFVLMSLINYETSNKHMNKQLINHSLANLKSTVANLDTMLDLRMKQAELLSESIPIRMQTMSQKLAYLNDEVHLKDITTSYIGIA